MFKTLITKTKTAIVATGALVASGVASAAPSANATALLTTLQDSAAAWTGDVTAILMAGAAISIAGYLVFKLVNLVVGFFKRG